MSIINQRLKSKTYWLGAFVLALTYTQQNFGLIERHLGESAQLIDYGIGLSILLLRELTKKPLSEKGKPDADKI